LIALIGRKALFDCVIVWSSGGDMQPIDVEARKYGPLEMRCRYAGVEAWKCRAQEL